MRSTASPAPPQSQTASAAGSTASRSRLRQMQVGVQQRNDRRDRQHGEPQARAGQPEQEERDQARVMIVSLERRQNFARPEILERAKGFEPSTPTLARLCSTPELHPHPRWVRRPTALDPRRSCYAKERPALQPCRGRPMKPPMPASPDELFAYLDSLGIAHKTVTHPAVFTVDEGAGCAARLPAPTPRTCSCATRRERRSWSWRWKTRRSS